MTGLAHAFYVMIEHVIPYLISVSLEPNAVSEQGSKYRWVIYGSSPEPANIIVHLERQECALHQTCHSEEVVTYCMDDIDCK